MTQCVVYRFEAVKINKENGERLTVALASTNRFLELLCKKTSIRQQGQVVVLRAFLQFNSSPHDISDVAESNNSTDERTTTVIESLAVDAENGVGLAYQSVHGNLVGKLLTPAGFDEW